MVKEDTKLRLIYIMGMEHNGSTFLGVTLGNHQAIEFAGELSLLPREGWNSRYLCTCGEAISTCPYWIRVREVWENSVNDEIDALIRLETKYDRNRRFPNLFLKQTLESEEFERYSTYVKALFEAIREVSGKETIVDSSKRFSRALALASVEGVDLRIIHLIRDARGVAYSLSKPTRLKQRSWWHSSFRWVATNTASDLVSNRVGDQKILRLRYEDFITNPRNTLEQIGRFVDLDLDSLADLLEKDHGMTVSHIGIGNGFLQNRAVVKLQTIVDWPEKMPVRDQRNVWRVTQRKMRRYGYQEIAPTDKSDMPATKTP